MIRWARPTGTRLYYKPPLPIYSGDYVQCKTGGFICYAPRGKNTAIKLDWLLLSLPYTGTYTDGQRMAWKHDFKHEILITPFLTKVSLYRATVVSCDQGK